MIHSSKTGRLLLTAAAFLLICSGTPTAQTIISDDFNRPDGTVGNGWSSWWGLSYDHPNISLLNGELVTHGYPNQAGGIYRTLPLTFPLAFSFDFRTPLTVGDNQCSLPSYNEGGWLIAFNAAAPSSLPPYPPHDPAQLMFYQYAGSRNVGRSYQTAGGTVFDAAPGLPEPVAGQRDYQPSPAHIEGTINSDLSATITIRYNDGQTPDPVTVTFGPASAPVSNPPGSVFVLGNGSCNTGQQIFDNLRLSVPLPAQLPAQLDDSSQTAALAGWRYTFGTGLSGTFDTLSLKAGVSGCVPHGASLTEWADSSYTQLVNTFDPAERVYVNDAKPWGSDPSTWTHDLGVMEWRWDAPITFNPEHYYALGPADCGDQSRRITFRIGTGDKGFGDLNGDPAQDLYFAFSRPSADLSISMTASPNPVVVGSRVTYAVTVKNNGPDAARHVMVTDDLPDATFFSSCSPFGAGVCAGSANHRTVEFQSLAAGESQTVLLYATVKCSAAGATVGNTAAVSSKTGDPEPGNNSASATTNVSAPPQGVACPALPVQLDDPSQTALVYSWRYTFGTGLVGTFDRLALEAGVYDCVPHNSNLTEWADSSYSQLVATYEPDARVYADDGKPWSSDSSTWRHDVGVMEWRWNTPITFNPEHYYALGPADCGDQSRRIAFRMSAGDKGFGDFNGDPAQDVYFLFSSSGAAPLACAPVFNGQPASTTVLSGQPATLTAAVSGSGLSYQWYSGASGDTSHPINGATGSTYTTAARSGLSHDQYWVRARNNCGATDSDTALVVTTDKMPLIFIPGIAGSQLDLINPQGPNTSVWAGPGGLDGYHLLPNLSLDPTDSHFGSRFDVRNVVLNYPDGSDNYQTFLDFLVAKGYRDYITKEISRPRQPPCAVPSNQSTLFVFPYDWRQSIAANVNPGLDSNVSLLKQYVDCIQEIYPGAKVNIVSHSYGGLLARRYLTDHPTDNRVNKLITVAAPWLGAPKAINVLETGDFGLKRSWYLFGIDLALAYDRFKGLAKYFPGEHELLPSKKYFELTLLAPYRLGDSDLSYNEYFTFLDHQFSPSLPASNNSEFHRHALQDDSSGDPNLSGVSFVHIYGLQRGRHTIGQVKDNIHSECNEQGQCYQTPFDVELTYGDGTVPVVSATRRGRGQDLNEPSALVVSPAVPADDKHNEEVEHTGLLRNQKVKDTIKCLLDAPAREQEISCTGTLQQATGSQQEQSAASDNDPVAPAYYLNIRGATAVTVNDDAGNSLTLYPIRQTTGDGLPAVTAYVFAEGNAKLVLPADQTLTVTFRSGSAAMGLDLTLADDLTTQAIRYRDLTLPADVSAMLKITPQGPEPLKYDKDGGGIFNETVTPTASVTGTAAQDTDPPSVAISSAIQGSNDLVTVNSSDSGSGVKATYYSLDGTKFQAYASQFVVDPRQSPVVYAFADDNVANRSGLVSYTLPIPEPTPTPTPAPSSISSVSGSGVFNGTATLTAALASGSTPLSGKAVSFTLNGTPAGNATTDAGGVATLMGVSLSGAGAGIYAGALAASFAGDVNFTDSSGTGALSVSKADQTITFGTLPDITFGALDFSVSATASSGLSVSFASTGNCTVGGGTVHVTGAGPCTIKASQGGNSNYNAAADVSRSFTIKKANQTISFGALSNKTFGDPDFSVGATVSSGLGVSFSASGQCSVSGSTVHVMSAGSCTITASQGGSTNFNMAKDVQQGFTISKAGSTTTVTAGNATFDGQPHGATAGVTGAGGLSQNLMVTYTGRNATSYGPSVTAPTNAGDYTASASFAGDDAHSGSSDSKDFQIAKTSQTISFGALANKTFGDPDFIVSATDSSGLAVRFSATGNCTASGNVVHILGAGSCAITASQAGDSNYNAAASVTQSFQVAKAVTATSLLSSANPSGLSQGVTFMATVTSAASAPTGLVQFKADGNDLGTAVNCIPGGGNSCTAQVSTSALSAGNHAIAADYSGDANFNSSSGALADAQSVGGLFEFTQPIYTVSERDGSVTIAVRRTGDTGRVMSVDYATDDGSIPSVFVPCSAVTGLALERCDYARSAGTLQFAAGETEKTFAVLVNDDSYVEGTETTHLRLSNPLGGAALGQQASATLRILEDAPASSGNSVDDSQLYVRQHYHDFLNREPDASGLNFWTNDITNCGSDAQCVEVKRINVSAAFFLSIEFQETGYLVYRMYKASYGNLPGKPVPVRLRGFLADTQQIGLGVQVNVGNWQQQLESNKSAFAVEFVSRPQFASLYALAMTPSQFVDALYANAGVTPSASERQATVDEFGGAATTGDAAARARALRRVAENAAFARQEFKGAFVLMQYFGYLRRNPDDAPDSDFGGYQFWLSKLNQFNGNFVQAEMVKAFLNSTEYRQRFGP